MIKKVNNTGFSLVELIVALAITSIIMVGMSVFFTSTFQNIFTAQETITNKQEQFVTNEIIRDKLLTGIDIFNSSGTDVVIQNDISTGSKPFTYFGTANIDGDDRAVFKDFFVFIGMTGSTNSRQTPNNIKNPAGMAYANSTYYVAVSDEDEIRICDPIGTCPDGTVITDVLIEEPIDVTSDPGGDLYVTTLNNGILKIADPGGAGESVTPIPADIENPMGIAYYEYDSNEYLFVSDAYNNVVKRVDIDGSNPVTVAGLDEDSACNNSALYCKLDFPTGLLVTEEDTKDYLYIADTGSGRVLKVSDPGDISTGPTEITFQPSGGSVNIGLIKLTFDEEVDLDTALEATDHSVDLHVGSYEVAGADDNEFWYKFYTQFYSTPSSCYDSDDDGCIEWTTNVIRVYDDVFRNGDDVTVNTPTHSSMHISSDAAPAAEEKFRHNIFTLSDFSNDFLSLAQDSNMILDGNTYSEEQSFKLDLSGATGIGDYNLVTIDIYEANETLDPPIATDPDTTTTLIIRNGDGVLGTSEDTIEVVDSGLTYPTGLGWTGDLEVYEYISYDQPVDNFDYVSDFVLNNPLSIDDSSDPILDVTIDAVIGEDNKEYEITTAIK